MFRRAGPKLAVYTHIIGPTEALVTRTRAAGYVGPLELGQDLTAVEVGDTVSIQRCASPTTPVITAVTNDRLDSRIAVGDTIVVSGSGFSTAGNALMWTPAGNASGQASVTLDESGGLFFRNQSAGEIDAAPGPGLTKGQWTLRVRSGCSVSSAAVSVTIR